MTDGPQDPDDTTGAPGPRGDTDSRTEQDAGLTGGAGAAEGPPVGEENREEDAEEDDDSEDAPGDAEL